jgi:hypothetical protein
VDGGYLILRLKGEELTRLGQNAQHFAPHHSQMNGSEAKKAAKTGVWF